MRIKHEVVPHKKENGELVMIHLSQFDKEIKKTLGAIRNRSNKIVILQK